MNIIIVDKLTSKQVDKLIYFSLGNLGYSE